MPSGNGQPRTYSIAGDITSGQLNSSALEQEIIDDVAIVTALDRIDSTGDVLDIFFATDLSAPEITALDADVLNHAGTKTFRGFQFWEDSTLQSTTLEVYQVAMARTSRALGDGPYILTWSFEMRVNATGALNSAGEARFRLDNTTKASLWQPIDEWQVFSGWDRQHYNEGETALLEIEFRRNPGVGGNDTIEVRKMKLGIESKSES